MAEKREICNGSGKAPAPEVSNEREILAQTAGFYSCEVCGRGDVKTHNNGKRLRRHAPSSVPQSEKNRDSSEAAGDTADTPEAQKMRRLVSYATLGRVAAEVDVDPERHHSC